MSFFEKLQKKILAYFDKLVSDPEAEAREKKRLKDLKAAQNKANKIIDAERNLLKKAQTTQSPGRPEEALRYSIFPEDAKEWQAFLDNATSTVANAEQGQEVDDFIKDHFNEDYENYKINCIFNSSVYAKGVGGRVGLWLIIRAVKQLLHDNEDLTQSEISLLNTVTEDIKKILVDVKYKKISDWQPIAVEDLKNLDNYKKIFQTPHDKIDKDSEEYKTVILLAPKLNLTVMKLLKNHGELDYNEEGDGFAGTPPASATAVNEKNQDNFSASGAANKALNISLKILYYLTMLFLAVLGASLGTNLNVHKPVPYRILYMIYGCMFGIIVVPYVLLYRWAYLGRAPRYYGFIPLIDGFFINPWTQFLLGWLTYHSDDKVHLLEEWRYVGKEIPT